MKVSLQEKSVMLTLEAPNGALLDVAEQVHASANAFVNSKTRHSGKRIQ